MSDDNNEITNNLTFLVQSLSGYDMAEAEEESIKKLVLKRRYHRLEIVKRWTLTQTEMTLKLSCQVIALLRDLNEIMDMELESKCRNQDWLSP